MRLSVLAFAILLAAAGALVSAQAQSDDELRTLNQRINTLHQAGKNAEAIPVAEQYARLMRDRFGTEHAEHAAALHALGSLYNLSGRPVEAEAVAKQSLTVREKLYGPSHPIVAESLILLADIDRAQGRKAEQEARIRRALAIREGSLGREHLLVAYTLASLALLCDDRPECAAEAELAMKRVITIREKGLGPDNQITVISRFPLARHYWRTGRLRDAEALYLQGISQWERLFPNEQADLAGLLHTLGEILRVQGRLEESLGLHLRGLAIGEKVLPPDSPRLIASFSGLALTATSLGRYADAAQAYERIIRIAPNDPKYSWAFEGLGKSYYSLGRYRDAEPAYTRALDLAQQARDSSHLDLVDILSNLGNVFQGQGRYLDAEGFYRRALSIKEKHLGHDHKDVAISLHSLASLYQYSGRYQEALQFGKRALDIREKTIGNKHPEYARSLEILAYIYRDVGRHVEAEPLLLWAIDVYQGANKEYQGDLADALQALATIRQVQNRHTDAETLLRRAIEIRKMSLGPEHPNLMGSYTQLAGFLDELGRGGEATIFLQKVLEIAEKTFGQDHPQALWSGVSLALREAEANPQMEIEPLIESARAVAENKMGSTHPALIVAATQIGRSYMVRENWPMAYHYLKRASEIAERKERYFDEGTVLAGNKSVWNEFSVPYPSAIRAAYRIEASSRHATLADEVFRFSQLALQTAASKALGQMAARFASGSGPLSQLVRERQDLIRQRTAAERRFLLQRTTPSGVVQAIGTEELGSELLAIEKRLAAMDERLKSEFPSFADLANPQPLTIAEVQAQLHSDEVFVQFVEAPMVANLPSELFVWVINKHKSRWASSELDAHFVDGLVRSLRCGLDETQWLASPGGQEGPSHCQQLLGLKSFPAGGQPLPFDLQKSHTLYRALLGPFEDLIKGKHILVVPSGTLASLPFQVLVTSPPDDLAGGDGAYLRAQWLVARQPITVLPSAASLKTLRRLAGASQASRPYAAFGNPILEGNPANLSHVKLASAARDRQGCPVSRTSARVATMNKPVALKPLARGGLADVDQIRRLLPLPETTDELCAVAISVSAPPSEVRLGASATEAEIKALSASGQLATYQILHFATHGALSGEIGGNAEPGLVLTPPMTASDLDDGYLTASEITNLKLDADWVILSACNTAAAGSANAESLSGLARAFFYAGARSLLVSHWAVDSDATVELVSKTFSVLGADPHIGQAEALRRSMTALIAKGGHYAHPATWAPFVLVGEGQAGIGKPTAKAAPTNLKKRPTAAKNQKSAQPLTPDWRMEILGR